MNEKNTGDARQGDRFAVDLTLYLLARFGLVVVVTAILLLAKVPLLVALAIAIVLGLPLGLLLFRGLNARVTAGLAERGERRKSERARLRAELRGEAGADDNDGEDRANS